MVKLKPQLNVEEMFKYHAPSPRQIERMGEIRSMLGKCAKRLLELTPVSAEQTLSIRALHLANMHANSSIVLSDPIEYDSQGFPHNAT